MVITNEFVIVHVPKTGGMFLRSVTQETVGVALHVSRHAPYEELPEQYRELPAIWFRRNPWDWYVSFWHYRQTEGKIQTFPQFMAWAFKQSPDPYTRLHRKILGDADIEVGRFECLREDFVAFLDRHQIEAPALRERVLEAPPVNASQRSDYREYYDDELRELVAGIEMARLYEY
jgi:hypothetical protein